MTESAHASNEDSADMLVNDQSDKHGADESSSHPEDAVEAPGPPIDMLMVIEKRDKHGAEEHSSQSSDVVEAPGPPIDMLMVIEKRDKHGAEEHSSQSSDVVEAPGPPIDRGWAWMVLLGAVGMLVFVGGVLRSSGIFFVQHQLRFGTSASKTTLISTFFNISSSLSGPFIMTLGMRRMSVRQSVALGGVLVSVAHGISAFSPHFEPLILLLGACTGLSMSLVYLPTLSIIGVYFDKHRGLANSVTSCGASIGALTFGPVFTMLFEHYGYSGTLLIASGILLNVVVAASLMRPPELYTKPNHSMRHEHEIRLQSLQSNQPTATSPECNGHSISENVGHSTEHVVENTLSKPSLNGTNSSPRTVHRTQAHSADISKGGLLRPLLNKKRYNSGADIESQHGHVDNSVDVALWSSADLGSGSLPNLHFIEDDTGAKNSKHSVVASSSDKENKTTCGRLLSTVMDVLRTIFDGGLLKDPVFLHYSCFAASAIPPTIMIPMYLIPFAKDLGISTERIGILMFVLGGMDLVGRLAIGVVVDRKVLRPTTLLTIVFLIMAVMNNLTRLVGDFKSLMAFAVIQGALSGSYFSLFAMILLENVGVARFKSGLGFTSMFHGIAVAIVFPITGLLRDISGAYYWTYHLLSALQVAGAALAFTLPITYRRNRRSGSGGLEKTI